MKFKHTQQIGLGEVSDRLIQIAQGFRCHSLELNGKGQVIKLVPEDLISFEVEGKHKDSPGKLKISLSWKIGEPDERQDMPGGLEIIAGANPIETRTEPSSENEMETVTNEGGKVSAATLQIYLKGVDYPVNRQQLIDQAKNNDAPLSVLSLLQKLPDKQYSRSTEVSSTFSKTNIKQ